MVAATTAVEPRSLNQRLPAALLEMADAERAFARRAAETTVRQAFIDVFADEAINFEPDPVAAREALRRRTDTPPAGLQLVWEPRLGDVAASGDLGYLTGPAETIVPGRASRHSCYFSVWKRQANGEFRGILDLGVTTPSPPAFASGFERSAAVAAWAGQQSRDQSTASLLAADEALAAALPAGPGRAYSVVRSPSGRVHREGLQPMTGEQAIGPLCSLERELCPRCGSHSGPSLGPRSGPKRHWQPAKGFAGYQGRSPWLVGCSERSRGCRAR